MLLPTVILLGMYLVLLSEAIFPRPETKEEKTPEQELGDAIAKYISQSGKSPKE